MEPEIETIKSARLLKDALERALESLQKPIVEYPDDPAKDFFIACGNAIFFMEILTRDIIESGLGPYNFYFAFGLAKKLNNYNLAKKIVIQQLDILKDDDEEMLELNSFLETELGELYAKAPWKELRQLFD